MSPKVKDFATYLVVISEKLIQEINSLIANKPLIFGIDKAVPILLGESSENIIILCIELNLILVEIVEQVFCAENLGDLDQLI